MTKASMALAELAEKGADADFLRQMIQHVAQRLMEMGVETLCGAAYGERSAERPNSRNGFRDRVWETRAGAIDLKVPKLRTGSYFPGFLRAAVAYFAGLGITLRRVLTDNGSAFRSKRFAAACRRLGLKHGFTRPYRPQTNGKAERFIQSALREWAYGIPYQHSTERAAMLERWRIITTGIARTTALEVSHPCPDWPAAETTS